MGRSPAEWDRARPGCQQRSGVGVEPGSWRLDPSATANPSIGV